MRQLFTIFVLLFLTSCQEETFQHRPCIRVTISDAMPVQFWLVTDETHNEKETCGMQNACWCQPWNCDDEIVLQFTDTVELSPVFNLYVIDQDGNLLLTDQFDKTDIELNGDFLKSIYSYTLIPSDHDICDTQIQIFIAKATTETLFEDEFVSDLDGWTNEGSGVSFIHEAVAFGGSAVAESIGDGANADFTKYFTKTETGVAGAYRISFEAGLTNFGSAPFSFQIVAELYDASNTLIQTIYTETFDVTIAGSEPDKDIIFVTNGFAKIKIKGVLLTTSSFCFFYLKNVSLYRFTGADTSKSDCLSIKESHSCTELFQYSNHRNFAGLEYANYSPVQSFYLRIPCKFFHQRFPEEDEAMELTSSVITTSSQMKSQKLLQVQMVPYFFHKKVKVVLKHQTLRNNSTDWKKEEAYEIIEGRNDWPLKPATCYLTEKSSVVRNVI